MITPLHAILLIPAVGLFKNALGRSFRKAEHTIDQDVTAKMDKPSSDYGTPGGP